MLTHWQETITLEYLILASALTQSYWCTNIIHCQAFVYQWQSLFAELLHLSSKELHGCIYTKDKTCENQQLETQYILFKRPTILAVVYDLAMRTRLYHKYHNGIEGDIRSDTCFTLQPAWYGVHGDGLHNNDAWWLVDSGL